MYWNVPGHKSLTDRRNFSGPYVTNVGGTTGVEPELGSAFSGGGFSEVFERPDYQIDAVPPLPQQSWNTVYGFL